MVMSGSNRIGGAVRAMVQTSGSLLVAQGLSALLTILVARHLGPKLVGDLALVYTTVTIASVGFNWGFDLWLHQELVARQGREQRLVGQIIGIKIKLGLLLVPALAGLWLIFSTRQDLTPILVMVGLELVADGVVNSVSIGYHSAGRHLQGSWLTVAQRALKLLAFLLILTLGIASFPVIIAVRLGCAVMLLTVVLFTRRGERATGEPRQGARVIMRASGAYAVLSGLAMTYGQADVMLLGLLLPASDVTGQYSQALNILASLMLLPYAAYLVFVRRAAALVAGGNRPALFREYRLMLGVFVGIGFVMAIICLTVAPWLIRFLLNDAFLVSSQLVSMQAVTAILKSINLGLAAIMVVSFIVRPRMLVQLVSVTFNVGLNLALIPVLSGQGSVAAYAASEAVLLIGYSYAIIHFYRRNRMPPSLTARVPL